MINIRIYEEAAEGREPDLLAEIQSERHFAAGDIIELDDLRFVEVTEARRSYSVPMSTWAQVVHTKDALRPPD